MGREGINQFRRNKEKKNYFWKKELKNHPDHSLKMEEENIHRKHMTFAHLKNRIV